MADDRKREPGQRWEAEPAPRALWELVSDNFPEARNLGLDTRPRESGPGPSPARRSLQIGLSESDPVQKGLGDELFRLFCERAAALELEAVHWVDRSWTVAQPCVHPADEELRRSCLLVRFSPTGSQASELPAAVALGIAMLRTGREELGSANRTLG